jgi:hypothetical protein
LANAYHIVQSTPTHMLTQTSSMFQQGLIRQLADLEGGDEI